MNCKDFWSNYEDSGLTSELKAHLDACPSCQKEMEVEKALLSIVQDLPVHKAPDHLWDRIERELPQEKPEINRLKVFVEALTDGINAIFSPLHHLQLKPVLAGVIIMITSVLATHYYYTRPTSTVSVTGIEKVALRELEDIEREYLAAVENLTEQVELNKDSIDPELYDVYREKLAVLDEYIQQCKDAVDSNELNPNARKYLALAYVEKMETLREMSTHIM
ncbi:anti-sigma factor family protein [Candidatus Omnitrophota bacterium]